MAKKTHSDRASDNVSDAELANTLRVAAQHIWLAGLTALAKTQEESAKVFDALKSEGRHTGRSAQKRFAGVTGEMGRAASQATRGASGAIERLERMFDARIGRTLGHLGVPTAETIQNVMDRLEALESRSGTVPRKTAGGARAAAPTASKKAVNRKATAKARTKVSGGAPAKKRQPARTRSGAGSP